MKRIYLLLAMLTTFGMAHSQKHFIESFGETNTIDELKRVRATSDGGSIVTGYIQNGTDGNISLTKVDKNGQIQWSKTLGTDSLDAVEGITETADKGFVIVGETYVNDPNADDILVIKTNASGSVLWSVQLGGIDYDEPKNVLATPDSGVVIVGLTDSWKRRSSEAGITIKLNKNGVATWQHVVEGSRFQQSMYADKTSDGGYAVAGQALALTNPGTSFDATLTKYDRTGAFVWTHKYRRAGAEIIYGVKNTPDGGFVMAGVGNSTLAGYQSDVLLYKTDATGTVQWTKNFGTPQYDKPWDLTVGADSAYYLATQINIADSAHPKTVPAVVKISADGTFGWCKIYGDTTKSGLAYSIDRSNTEGFVMAAATFTYGDSLGNILLVHAAWDGSVNDSCRAINWPMVAGSFTVSDTILYTDSLADGTLPISINATANSWTPNVACAKAITTGIEHVEALNTITLYPNPTHHTLHIDNSSNEPVRIVIYNTLGVQVLNVNDLINHENSIDISSLSAGIYLTEVIQGLSHKTIKLVID
jgi:hypothetical protein